MLQTNIVENIKTHLLRQEGKHKQHEMGHIYILQPQNEENNQPLQTNGYQDSIQK